MHAQSRKVYICSNCGESYLKWQGQCRSCGSWNSLQEKSVGRVAVPSVELTRATQAGQLRRISTKIPELDRLLGSGLVAGSVILLGGEPGVGKSTLLLELAKCGHKTVYVSAEESLEQVRDRCERIGAIGEHLFFIQENHVGSIISLLEKARAELVLLDSIQAVWQEGGRGFSGSLAQIRECAQLFIEFAKKKATPVIMTGHITKDGQIAGPKLLEHAVDVVLYFESTLTGQERILRAVKNRFGHTGEIALFEMTSSGLKALPEGHYLIQVEQTGGIGSILFPQREGQHILPLEVQVLVAPSGFTSGRRIGEAIDVARIHLIAAILEKYAKYRLSQCDIFVRIRGGAPLSEPAGDLALLLAMASSYLEKPLPRKVAAVGEISLTGEIRSASYVQERLKSLVRLGMERVFWGGTPNVWGDIQQSFFVHVNQLLEEVFA